MICVWLCASFGENPTNEWALRNYPQPTQPTFDSFGSFAFLFTCFFWMIHLLTCIESHRITQKTNPNWKIHSFVGYLRFTFAVDRCWEFQSIYLTFLNLFTIMQPIVMFVSSPKLLKDNHLKEVITNRGKSRLYFIILLIHTNFNDL